MSKLIWTISILIAISYAAKQATVKDWLEKAKAAYAAKNVPKALEMFENARQVEPLNKDVLALIANAKVQLNDHRGAIKELSTLIEIDSNEIFFYSKRAEIYFQIGQFDKALEDYNTAIEKDPKNAELYVSRGITIQQARDLEHTSLKDALADFTKALRLNPTLVVAYQARAACKSTMGDHKEAVKDYDVAQYLTPNDTLTLIERGKVKALMEDFSGAIDDLSEGLKIEPENWEILLWRATTYKKMKEFEKAQKDLDDAAKVGPDEPIVVNRMHKISLEIKEYFEDWNGVNELAHKLQKLDSNDLFGFVKGALAKIHLKDYTSAISDATRGIRVSPINVEAYLVRGKAYFASGQYQRALADFEKAEDLSSNEDDPLVLLEMAKVMTALGDIEGALERVETILESQSNHTEALKLKKELETIIANPPFFSNIFVIIGIVVVFLIIVGGAIFYFVQKSTPNQRSKQTSKQNNSSQQAQPSQNKQKKNK